MSLIGRSCKKKWMTWRMVKSCMEKLENWKCMGKIAILNGIFTRFPRVTSLGASAIMKSFKIILIIMENCIKFGKGFN